MVKLKPIAEQSVAIMGCASGIGRETALCFAARGARLVLADNDGEGLQTLAQDIQLQGGTAVVQPAEVTDPAQVQAVAARAAQEYGRLDTWVHVVGVSAFGLFEELPLPDIQRQIEVDLLGQMYGAKAALPYLKAQGGALIHISSIEAMRSFPLNSAYGAAKHGVHGFIEALRVELMHEHAPVSVTEIMPSGINTPFFDKARTYLGVKPTAPPPLYSPRTVADAVLYAAEHPTREIVVGGMGKMLLSLQRFSPSLVDRIAQFGFKPQRTNVARSPEAPSDLYGPVGMYNRVNGDFGKRTLPFSLSTWLDTHPIVRRALWGTIGLTTAGAWLWNQFGGKIRAKL